jgi:hypothetical protein
VANLPVTVIFQRVTTGTVSTTCKDVVFTIALTALLSIAAASFFIGPSATPDVSAPTIVAQIGSAEAVALQVTFIAVAVLLLLFKWTKWLVLHSVGAGFYSALVVLFTKPALHLFNSEYSLLATGYSALGVIATFGMVFFYYTSSRLHIDLRQTQDFISVSTIVAALANMVAGGVVFRDFQNFNTDQWIMFGVGTGLLVLTLCVSRA